MKDLKQDSSCPSLLYISRGVLLLGALVTSSPEVTLPIIADITRQTSSGFVDAAEYIKIASVGQNYAVLFYHLAVTGNYKNSNTSYRMAWMKEILKSTLYVALFLCIDPLVAFAIYFGFWHSLGSIMDEIIFFKSCSGHCPTSTASKQTKSITSEDIHITDIITFLRLSIPYTSVALLSMILFYSLTFASLSIPNSTTSSSPLIFLSPTKLWSVFVMSISVLTGPHMWLMGILHKGFNVSLDPLKTCDVFGWSFIVASSKGSHSKEVNAECDSCEVHGMIGSWDDTSRFFIRDNGEPRISYEVGWRQWVLEMIDLVLL
jgi:Brp/Blh family beta-carotene 15,15'-monooxygenase